MNDVLEDIKATQPGPTGSSRAMYTFAMANTIAWNYIKPSVGTAAAVTKEGVKAFPSGTPPLA